MSENPSVVLVQKRVSEVVEKATGLRVVSVDKLEGIDSLRPVFIVDAEMDNHSIEMKNWATNDVSVDVWYYGRSTADCKQVGDMLHNLFDQPLRIGGVIVTPDSHNAFVASEYVLSFSMNISYLSTIDTAKQDITMGDVPHITDHNTDKMGEIIAHNMIIKEELTNGSY